MRLPLGDTRSQRQYGLGPVQRLNLALFVYAQHQCLLRRVLVQPDDIANLLSKLRIPAELERIHSVRLKLVSLPDTVDRRVTHALSIGHQPCTPVRRLRRFRTQRRLYDRRFLFSTDDLRATTSRRIFENALDTRLLVAPAPLQHRALRG